MALNPKILQTLKESGWRYEPRLDDLISACGDGFEALIKQAGGWAALSCYPSYMMKDGVSRVGDSPEDAVALLWLALRFDRAFKKSLIDSKILVVEKKKLSRCCNAEILWKESGVSQLSYDVSKKCSKCGTELPLEPGDI